MSNPIPSPSASSSSDPSSSTLLLKKSKGLLAEAAIKLRNCPKNDFLKNLKKPPTNEISSNFDSPDLLTNKEKTEEVVGGDKEEEKKEESKANMDIKLRPSKKGKKYDWPSVIKQNDTEHEKVIEKEKNKDDRLIYLWLFNRIKNFFSHSIPLLFLKLNYEMSLILLVLHRYLLLEETYKFFFPEDERLRTPKEREIMQLLEKLRK